MALHPHAEEIDFILAHTGSYTRSQLETYSHIRVMEIHKALKSKVSLRREIIITGTESYLPEPIAITPRTERSPFDSTEITMLDSPTGEKKFFYTNPHDGKRVSITGAEADIIYTYGLEAYLKTKLKGIDDVTGRLKDGDISSAPKSTPLHSSWKGDSPHFIIYIQPEGFPANEYIEVRLRALDHKHEVIKYTREISKTTPLRFVFLQACVQHDVTIVPEQLTMRDYSDLIDHIVEVSNYDEKFSPYTERLLPLTPEFLARKKVFAGHYYSSTELMKIFGDYVGKFIPDGSVSPDSSASMKSFSDYVTGGRGDVRDALSDKILKEFSIKLDEKMFSPEMLKGFLDYEPKRK